MSEKTGYVEIKVQISKRLMNVLEAFWQFLGYTHETAEEYLGGRISNEAARLIGDMLFNEITDFAEQIIKKYDLEPFRKDMDIPTRI